MTEGFYHPNDLIMGFNFLVEKHKKDHLDSGMNEDVALAKAKANAINEFVRCDYTKLEKAKEYNGARFFPNTEVYLGCVNGAKLEYGYKTLRGLKFARVSVSNGAMAHDHPKREGFGVALGISDRILAKGDQKLGEALKLLSEAGEVLLNNSVEHIKKFKSKPNITVSVPYRTVSKDNKPLDTPTINVKIKFNKVNPKGQTVELTDKPEIPIKDVTKKNQAGNDFLPLMVEGKVLNYGNIHKVLTRGSEISGSIGFSACHSGLGLSIIFTFTTLVVKSAGENTVSAATVLGDDYADLLNEAGSYSDDTDTTSTKADNPEPQTKVDKQNDAPDVAGADDFF